MTQAPTFYRQNKKDIAGYNTSNRSTSEIKQWGMLIGLPIIGILLMMVCFLLQGIFAFVGPWLILLGVKLIHKKMENK